MMKRPRPAPPRKLTLREEQQALQILHHPRFMDRAPGEIFATLLDENQYLCSERTFYRLLTKHGEVKERRNQLRHPNHPIPRLVASAPNQVWSWDITKLRGPQKYKFYYLYVIIDIFSRYVPGWMLAEVECEEYAKILFEETLRKHKIPPGQLQSHSDRGAPMCAITFGEFLAEMGVRRSFSRPRVSNDNCYSEAQFKTVKYAPGYPGRFGSIHDANPYFRKFFTWYNGEHRHSGIGWMTPKSMHFGFADQLYQKRVKILDLAYQTNPDRFVNHRPAPAALPKEAWINRPTAREIELALH